MSLAPTTAAFLALRRERDGLALGAVVLEPQLALGFAVVRLVQRRRRAIAVATAMALAACALSHVLRPGRLGAVRAPRARGPSGS